MGAGAHADLICGLDYNCDGTLASGGSQADRTVCLWNAASGRRLSSTKTDSQVTDIIWGLQERELVTAHGFSRNQLSLWKYPSLLKAAEDLHGHDGRLLGLARSPEGDVVCSASADETLRLWQIFTPISKHAKDKDRNSAGSSILKMIR